MSAIDEVRPGGYYRTAAGMVVDANGKPIAYGKVSDEVLDEVSATTLVEVEPVEPPIKPKPAKPKAVK